MNLQGWEEFCRRQGVVPVETFEHRLGKVYVAEGFQQAERDPQNGVEARSHFRIFWMVHRGRADVAQELRISAVAHPLRRDRMAIVRQEVEEWMAVNEQRGRYS